MTKGMKGGKPFKCGSLLVTSPAKGLTLLTKSKRVTYSFFSLDDAQMFDSHFLNTLSDWQRGWRENQERRRQIADELVKVCEPLPKEFKKYNKGCYRKRFIVGGEIVPIVLNNDFFEGIASWTSEIGFAKNFKALIKSSTTFAMIFKHQPRPNEIIVNVNALWKNREFREAVDKLNIEEPTVAEPLLKMKVQGEIVLRSTLRGSEIEHIVGMSHSFDEICDKGRIPLEEREELSKKYSMDPDGIPIDMPVWGSKKATNEAVKKTISKMKSLIENARKNKVPIYNLVYEPHKDDLKHKV
jgi:hypothetical protein